MQEPGSINFSTPSFTSASQVLSVARSVPHRFRETLLSDCLFEVVYYHACQLSCRRSGLSGKTRHKLFALCVFRPREDYALSWTFWD